MPRTRNDYDSPWKEALSHYFRPFVQFFFPAIDSEIDWDQGFDFLDNELRQMVRESEIGRRAVDALVRVFLVGGGEAWVLIHIEVQAQVDPQFAERMFVYHYRLYDRDRRPVISMAVLGDPRPDWRPDVFEMSLGGCRCLLQFPTVKLLDYEDSLDALEQSRNPFAVLVAAHLLAQKTWKGSPERFRYKVRLVRSLHERGMSREDVAEVFRLVDWMIALPRKDAPQFWEEIIRYEEEKKMPFISTGERIGLKKGRREGLERGAQQGVQDSVLNVLDSRFPSVPDTLRERVRGIHDRAALDNLVRQAITIESLESFERALPDAKKD